MQLLVGWGFVRVGVVRFSQPAVYFTGRGPPPCFTGQKRGNPGGGIRAAPTRRLAPL